MTSFPSRSGQSHWASVGLGLALLAATTPALAVNLPVVWDAPEDSPDVIKYRVYRAYQVEGPYTLLKTISTTRTTVEVPLGETRCVRIKAVDDLGQASEYSWYLCHSITVETGE